MVDAEERLEVGQPDGGYSYHPARIDGWLMAWPALQSAAERVGAVQLRLTPPSTRHLFADGMRGADIQADILMAHDRLGPESKGYRLIYLVIFGRWQLERWQFARDRDWRGYVIRSAGYLLGLDPEAAHRLYWQSVREMARHLGWRPADERS